MVTDPRPTAHRLPAALASLALLAAVTAGCGGTEGPVSHPESAAAPTADAAPVNASPAASVRPPHTPPPPPEVEPRSEWSIDESIPTPEELQGLEILAKFKKGADLVIIYRAKNGDVYRRVEGSLGSYKRVEESKIELEP